MSDDDEGITAVEAAGGERVQLQRIQRAGVLAVYKQLEAGDADVRRLFGLLDAPVRRHRRVSHVKEHEWRVVLFVPHIHTSFIHGEY